MALSKAIENWIEGKKQLAVYILVPVLIPLAMNLSEANFLIALFLGLSKVMLVKIILALSILALAAFLLLYFHTHVNLKDFELIDPPGTIDTGLRAVNSAQLV